MASSSVSQDDVDVDFELSSRRSRIRTARARNINHLPSSRTVEADGECENSDKDPTNITTHGDHDASPKPATRVKDKRNNRSNQLNKGKQQRDRRKLREKRRSTGVVQIYSTESNGGSSGEDDDLLSMTAETRRNTLLNEEGIKKDLRRKESSEILTQLKPTTLSIQRHKKPSFTSKRNNRFSPSDLEADDEDNQDYDSLTMSDSVIVESNGLKNLGQPPSSAPLTASRPTNGRPATPVAVGIEEQLDRAHEENRRLLSLLEEKDKRLATLEKGWTKVAHELSQAKKENYNLQNENATLIRAMAVLSSK